MKTPASSTPEGSSESQLSPSGVFASILGSKWLTLVFLALATVLIARIFYAF